MRGLLLTGGGARGAYQAGGLLGISGGPADRGAPFPFPVLTGISAGAINAVGLAARAPDFGAGARGLADLWRGLTMEQVFRTDAPSLFTIGLGWMKNLLFGGVVGHRRFNALLNPSPLRALLGRA